MISLSAGWEKIAGVDLFKQTHNPRRRMKILHSAAGDTFSCFIALINRQNLRLEIDPYLLSRHDCEAAQGEQTGGDGAVRSGRRRRRSSYMTCIMQVI